MERRGGGGATLTYGSIGPILTSQQWDLDMLGNWKEFIRDASGNGTYGDSTDLVDDRDHNAANEIEESSLRHDGTTPTPVNVPFSYDNAGNIKTAQLETTGGTANLVNRRYIHDAWNRLVEVVHSNGTTGTSDKLARQQSCTDRWVNKYGADVIGEWATQIPRVDKACKVLWKPPPQ